jgi:hypothetical protein
MQHVIRVLCMYSTIQTTSRIGGRVWGFHRPIRRWVGGGRLRSLKNPNPRVRGPCRCMTWGSNPGVPSGLVKPVQIEGHPEHWLVGCDSPPAMAAWLAPATAHTCWTYSVQNSKDWIHESNGKFFLHHLDSPFLDDLDLLSMNAYEHSLSVNLSADDMLWMKWVGIDWND